MKLKKNDVILIRWCDDFDKTETENCELGVVDKIEDNEIQYFKLDINPLSFMDKELFNDEHEEGCYYAPLCLAKKVGEY